MILPEPMVCDAIWEDEEIPQPDYPYVSMKRTAGPIKEGGLDENRHTFDAARPVGEEIEIQTTGPRAFTLTVQAHVGKPVDHGRDATALLSRLSASVRQNRTQEIFDTYQLSAIEVLDVSDLSAFENGRWVSRASLDVRFRVLSVITEQLGYIDKVEVESTELGIPSTVLDAS